MRAIRQDVRQLGCALLLAVILCLGGTGPTAAADPATPLQSALAAAESAHGAGDRLLAAHHLMQAEALAPGSSDILRRLLELRDDADSRLLTLCGHVESRCDADGEAELPEFAVEAGGDLLAEFRAVLADRAAVVRDVGELAAAWRPPLRMSAFAFFDDLADAVAAASPGLHASYTSIRPASGPLVPDVAAAESALRKLAYRRYHAGDDAAAIEPFRLLLGLHTRRLQMGIGRESHDSYWRDAMQRSLAIARCKVAESETRVWTRAQLEAIPPGAHTVWNERHASWSNPAVGVTSDGRYRVETVCGILPLIETLKAAERAHLAVASWFGKDPFVDEQGIVRVTKSELGLQREGQVHDWSVGWQSGNVTVFRWPESERGLLEIVTHELTHRFDGRLNPGLPGWLLEGRAEHAEESIQQRGPTRIDDRAVSTWRIARALDAGYDRADKLQRLLEGRPEDYRDNYAAGYALWLFLRHWPGEVDGAAPPYAAATTTFLERFSTLRRGSHMSRFAQAFFVEGDGRAASVEQLSRQLSAFCRALTRESNRPPWAEALLASGREARGSRHVARWSRAELRGNDHVEDRPAAAGDAPGSGSATRFAEILVEHGHAHDHGRVAAIEWASDVDGLSEETLDRLTSGPAATSDPRWTWLVRRRALGATDAGPPPDAVFPELQETLRTLLGRMDALARRAREGGHPRLAFAISADRNRIARCLGWSAIGTTRPSPAIEERFAYDAPLPDCPPRRSIGVPIRVSGRSNVRIALDGRATGTFTIRTSIALEEPGSVGVVAVRGRGDDASIRLVVRRSRLDIEDTPTYLRLELETEEQDPRSRPVPSRHVRLPAGIERCELTLRVAGPYVRVTLDGLDVISHRTETGRNVAGAVEFHGSAGTVSFERTQIRRHRTTGPDRTCCCGAFDAPLDVSRPADFSWPATRGRRLVGLDPGPEGLLVGWCGAATDDARKDTSILRRAARNGRTLWDAANGRPRVLLALPADRGATHVARTIRSAFDRRDGRPDVRVVRHAGHAGFSGNRAGPDGGVATPRGPVPLGRQQAPEPMWIYVDPRGVVRLVQMGAREPSTTFLEHLKTRFR